MPSEEVVERETDLAIRTVLEVLQMELWTVIRHTEGSLILSTIDSDINDRYKEIIHHLRNLENVLNQKLRKE